MAPCTAKRFISRLFLSNNEICQCDKCDPNDIENLILKEKQAKILKQKYTFGGKV